MKKKLLFLALILSINFSHAQVFNTGETLSHKAFSIGVEPVGLMNGSNDFMLFIHGGYGIKKGVDLCITGGLLGTNSYFGANLEFSMGRHISLAFGAHDFGNFGIDGTLNTSIGITRGVKLYAGLDSDLNFLRMEILNS